MEEGTLQEVLSVGNRPWPSVKGLLFPFYSTLIARVILRGGFLRCAGGAGETAALCLLEIMKEPSLWSPS